MSARTIVGLPVWTVVAPIGALAVLGAAWGRPLGWPLLVAVAVVLVAAVLVAVHHAETIAHRVGEPFGTLVLALAVTVIEVALIVSMMLSADGGAAALARDTVYATVMVVCNGVVGLCLLVAGLRHHETEFRVAGTGQALAVLIPLAVITLVLPNFTTSTPGPTYTTGQVEFIGVLSLILYLAFVFVQTVRHRDYFLPVHAPSAEEVHAPPPSNVTAAWSLLLLLASLVGVVGLAKTLAPSIEAAVAAVAAPPAVVGIAIAMLVLLPETIAALRAASANRIQTSLNLSLGSALATIGLTVPAIAGLSVLLGVPLELGLAPKEMVLLLVTLLLSSVTLASGRSTMLHGVVHLVVCGAFLFLSVVP